MKQNLETKVGLFLMLGIAIICALIISFASHTLPGASGAGGRSGVRAHPFRTAKSATMRSLRTGG